MFKTYIPLDVDLTKDDVWQYPYNQGLSEHAGYHVGQGRTVAAEVGCSQT